MGSSPNSDFLTLSLVPWFAYLQNRINNNFLTYHAGWFYAKKNKNKYFLIFLSFYYLLNGVCLSKYIARKKHQTMNSYVFLALSVLSHANEV